MKKIKIFGIVTLLLITIIVSFIAGYIFTVSHGKEDIMASASVTILDEFVSVYSDRFCVNHLSNPEFSDVSGSTYSMYPTLNKGHKVVYVKVNVADINIGDIIVFNIYGETEDLAVHRVVSIIKDSNGQIIGFNTKGDNNTYYEEISSKDVVGRVIAILY